MTRSHRSLVTFACAALMVLGLTGTVLIARASAGEITQSNDEVLLISSPTLLKRMSLGYSGVIADLYWTRAVQYFGRTHADRGSGYKLLSPILTITTELDPKLTIAYEYGAVFLAQKPPDGAGEPEHAVTLVRRGIEHNPENWHLYYTLGFIYGMELKDFHSAAQAFAEGARIPGAHPWMRVIAAQMAAHGADPAMAHYMWLQMYQSATEKQLHENAEKHLRAAEVQMDIAQLQRMVDDYAANTGREPASLAELVRPDYLFRLPKDPTGWYYILGRNGRVTVEHPNDFPFLEPNEKTDPLLALAKKR
jgi:tetratricopeptide (TPR) repeat protein